MHAEELKHKPVGTLQGILIVLALVFGIYLCITVVNFLQFWLEIYWLQFILYGLMIIVAIFIVKNMIMEYIYLIEKDRITFGRRIGRREKELLFIPLRDIRAFGSFETMKDKVAGKKRFKYTFKKKRDWYVIDGGNCAVIFSPTEEYVQKLKEATGK